jgi:hypothetical protein
VQGTSLKDTRILQRVDEACATLHTTRAVVLYALLRGAVAEGLSGASTHMVELTAPDDETRATRAARA